MLCGLASCPRRAHDVGHLRDVPEGPGGAGTQDVAVGGDDGAGVTVRRLPQPDLVVSSIKNLASWERNWNYYIYLLQISCQPHLVLAGRKAAQAGHARRRRGNCFRLAERAVRSGGCRRSVRGVHDLLGLVIFDLSASCIYYAALAGAKEGFCHESAGFRAAASQEGDRRERRTTSTIPTDRRDSGLAGDLGDEGSSGQDRSLDLDCPHHPQRGERRDLDERWVDSREFFRHHQRRDLDLGCCLGSGLDFGKRLSSDLDLG